MSLILNANTKLAAILKQNPEALEAIVSLSNKFSKLRNPLLRKLMAGRTSIAMASKIGGCKVEDFFMKLKPLGFAIDNRPADERVERTDKPAFLSTIHKDQLIEFDVRPVFESGKDPLELILEKIRSLKPGQVLKLLNSFEPTPLMLLLKKQGFESFAEPVHEQLVYTYFFRTGPLKKTTGYSQQDNLEGWDSILEKFKGFIEETDVRNMEMPQPMFTILAALDNLQPGSALLVYHKRVPVFLLPELADRNFSYRIKDIREGEVQLLIFKD